MCKFGSVSAIFQAMAVLGGKMAILSALGVTLPPAVSGDLRIRPVSYLKSTLPFNLPHPFKQETIGLVPEAIHVGIYPPSPPLVLTGPNWPR